jgi:hypothetical protein
MKYTAKGQRHLIFVQETVTIRSVCNVTFKLLIYLGINKTNVANITQEENKSFILASDQS